MSECVKRFALPGVRNEPKEFERHHSRTGPPSPERLAPNWSFGLIGARDYVTRSASGIACPSSSMRSRARASTSAEKLAWTRARKLIVPFPASASRRWAGRPQPLLRISVAAVTRAAGGAFLSSIIFLQRSKRWGVSSRAAAFTSAMILCASTVAARLGLPLRLPLWPRFQEVDRRPPFPIAWLRLFRCLFAHVAAATVA